MLQLTSYTGFTGCFLLCPFLLTCLGRGEGAVVVVVVAVVVVTFYALPLGAFAHDFEVI